MEVHSLEPHTRRLGVDVEQVGPMWCRRPDCIRHALSSAAVQRGRCRREPEDDCRGQRHDVIHRRCSFLGLPVVTVPFAVSPEGLPVAIEVTARPWREDLAASLAHRLEQILALPDFAPSPFSRGQRHKGAETALIPEPESMTPMKTIQSFTTAIGAALSQAPSGLKSTPAPPERISPRTEWQLNPQSRTCHI